MSEATQGIVNQSNVAERASATLLNTAILSEYDFTVVVDASGSMNTSDCGPKGDKSRWEFMRETAMAFVEEINKIDADGLDFVIFNGSDNGIKVYNGVTPASISHIFDTTRPMSTTPLAEALTAAFGANPSSTKKKFTMVFTDGTPDDLAAVKAVIEKQAASQKTDNEQTVLFVQVGKDAAATAYLETLDKQLVDAKFDIVSAMTIKETEKFTSATDMVVHAISN
jgi:Mg-chelatase subunit ChlD